MQSIIRRMILLALFLGANSIFCNQPVIAQNQLPADNQLPGVYIDCKDCDYDYIRQEIRFVNFVRDQKQADIHLFITVEQTGGGGREYELTYLGRRKFSDMTFTYSHQVDRNRTEDEIRKSLNEAIRIGLGPFMMNTSLDDRFKMKYDLPDEKMGASREVDDPWNYWVFELYAGRLQMEVESNRIQFDSRWGVYADRVTEEWKIRLRPYFNFDYTEIDREEEPTLKKSGHRHGFNSYAIKSISDHWSAALFADYITRSDRNLKHRYRINPGIEYSYFPYEQATRKAITFDYRLGFSHLDYYEETIFQKTSEDLFNHQLSANVSYEQPWGSIDAGINGSHYFHDFNLRSIDMYGRTSLRLMEGLSLNLQFDYEIVQDQITLPRSGSEIEDILLDQRELATDFNARWLIAISYTFGSDFANIVNTRF